MWNFLKNIFSKALRAITVMLKEVFDVAFKILMAKLKDIVIEIIKELATTNLTDDQKREEAFGRIKAYALKEVITVKDSDINLIIEVIYKNLKKRGIV